MSNDVPTPFTRSRLDFIHFTLASAGFFIAAGGVVISSVCLALTGLAVHLWGLAYFRFNP